MPFSTGGAVGESGAPTSSFPSDVDHCFVSIKRDDENLEGRPGENPVVDVQEIPTKSTSGNSVFVAAIIVMINFVAESMRHNDDDGGATVCSMMIMRHARLLFFRTRGASRGRTFVLMRRFRMMTRRKKSKDDRKPYRATYAHAQHTGFRTLVQSYILVLTSSKNKSMPRNEMIIDLSSIFYLGA